ncbi:hypothetical protein E2C05_27775 [Paracraurococcus ruber]|nr:hypothetical protein [Paracraurococcus ruber]TDG18959.1 hypothetical protein E2C05_27775 [Paracraurococcus ruber]
MTCAALPLLHHRTGLPDYDAARWTRLPELEQVLPTEQGWGVVLQRRTPRATGPVEVVAPETANAVLILVLGASRNECRLEGSGAARPIRLAVRRGDALLLPPGIASWWYNAAGAKGALQLHLSAGFLAGIADRAGLPGPDGRLRPGRLARDQTLDFLLRQIVREVRGRQPGWRRAVESAVTLATAQLLAGQPCPLAGLPLPIRDRC